MRLACCTRLSARSRATYLPPLNGAVLDRCGQEVRYVVDFYNAAADTDTAIGMHLDVRPALDSVGAALDRMWALMR